MVVLFLHCGACVDAMQVPPPCLTLWHTHDAMSLPSPAPVHMSSACRRAARLPAAGGGGVQSSFSSPQAHTLSECGQWPGLPRAAPGGPGSGALGGRNQDA